MSDELAEIARLREELTRVTAERDALARELDALRAQSEAAGREALRMAEQRPPVELFTEGTLDLLSGVYGLYLVNGTARRADGTEVWVAQTVAARLDTLPGDEAAQLEAVRAAALVHFAGPGAQWVRGADVRRRVSEG